MVGHCVAARLIRMRLSFGGASCALGKPACAWTLQVARLVPHLSNGEFVISELGVDPALNDVYKDMVVFVPGNKSEVRAHKANPIGSSHLDVTA